MPLFFFIAGLLAKESFYLTDFGAYVHKQVLFFMGQDLFFVKNGSSPNQHLGNRYFLPLGC
jgi:hypothetical protein